MEQNSGVKGWQWAVTVIVIIILIVLGYYMIKSGSKSGDTTNNEPTVEDTTNPANVNRVVISDQFPGNIVYLSSVQLANPGFVVIHKDNKGVPGDIIGSQYFDKGINPGKITLTSPTVEGGIYYAVLHTDDGDKIFSATKDLPIKDASGNIIMKLFRGSSTVSNEVKG
ncbi:MAG: hypothetical protein V4697_02370 [Patescibacteria group bacterium]